ncbi:MAG: hypothetical protein IKU38_00125 [Clostridia bacterium]|nr:hypothetical protein [Clostridia bacterium]
MNRKQTALTALYACLFALCTAMGRRITFAGDVWLKNTENYIRPLAAGDILLFFVLAFAVGMAMMTAQKNSARILSACISKAPRKRPVRFAALCALALLLVWLPYILSVAPGNIYVDSLSSISQMLEHGHPTSNHHPMFYTLMIGVFLKIGNVVFGSANIGVLMYSLFQTAVMIFCIVCVLTLMYHKRISGWIIGASMAYFMFVPLFPNYAMSMWKDALFSCMLLCLSGVLYFLITGHTSSWLWYVCYGAAGLGAMIFRNNGLYVFVGVTALSLFAMRRHIMRFLCAAAAALMIFVSTTSLATRVWNIYSDYVENVGIPLLQMGYTINHDGDFSEEEEEYLFRLMPEEVWNYAYRPCLVDGIKWNPQFDLAFLDETKGEFFKVWAGGLVKNPAEYVDAYLLATHGFWQPGVQNLYGFMDVQMNDNPYGIGFMDLFEKIFGFSLMPVLKDYPIFLGSGTLLWLVLLGMTAACAKKMKHTLPYMPAMLNWATVMIATPVAYSLRYVFVFALGLPLYLALPLLLNVENDR